MNYNVQVRSDPGMYWSSDSFAEKKNLIISFISPCPSIGKSTLARALAKLLNAMWINQDECGGKRNYLALIESAMRSKKIAIADKTNATEVQRNDLRQYDADFLWIYLDSESSEKTKKIAFKRLKNRKNHHKNLFFSKKSQEIISGFIKNFEPPTKLERSEKFIEIDIDNSASSILLSVLTKMQELQIIQSIPTNNDINLALKESLSYENNL